MNYNPEDYETVKSRKAKFYKDHEDGRIEVEILNTDHLEYVLIRAKVFLNAKDQEKNLPRGIGHGLEVRAKELSISNAGKTYESVNFSSWTENTEESAVGRALDNAGYSGNKKPSREEMQKADRMNKTMQNQAVVTEEASEPTERAGSDLADKTMILNALSRYPGDGFLLSIKNGVEKYGHMTDKQRAAVESKMSQPYKAQSSNI